MYMDRYVLECEKCGIIYRSRQYWYGNESPAGSVVREQYQHVWPGSVLGSEAHAGRQVGHKLVTCWMLLVYS